MTSPSPSPRSQLFICLFLRSEALVQLLLEFLSEDRYIVAEYRSSETFSNFVEQEKQSIDCLIVQEDEKLSKLTNQLQQQITLLPMVILQSKEVTASNTPFHPEPPHPATATQPLESQQDFDSFYHTAEVRLPIAHLSQISNAINQALAQFLNLSPACRLKDQPSDEALVADVTTQNFLALQQRRLTEKLRERLGYLGVYYKRDPRNFFRNLSITQRHEFTAQLAVNYREIILSYFSKDTSNQKIDEFVNTAFFADTSVAQIVEIHMELMDEFSKQLELEGRSEEILLDYRLTLIDIIAHLCEMYRRSIPRES